MFSKFSKWLTGLKAQRDEARAAMSEAARNVPEHGHSHAHFDGVIHDHGHGHGDHEHQHEHSEGRSGSDS